MDLEIRNVRVAGLVGGVADSDVHTVVCKAGVIHRVRIAERANLARTASPNVHIVDGGGGILLPSLCHSHIHLDKCFILGKGEPLRTGDFQEALRLTAAVKARFQDEQEDLYTRGTRLIRESVRSGVTDMRAHVEVDQFVGSTCLEVGLRLRKDWADQFFMQEPMFDAAGDREPGRNWSHLERILPLETGFSAIGSAPYVEHDDWQSKWNIGFILAQALEHRLHVDFHLDYNISASTEPLIYHVINELHRLEWMRKTSGQQMITIGHATRLTLFSAEELHALRCRIGNLPIHFIGLPQSDMYMMGRGDPTAPRGTLCVPKLISEYGLNAALSVNNVENAFTPQGAPDPLSLCPLGVAIYQAGTEEDSRLLLELVTTRSKQAIGVASLRTLIPSPGDRADFVILHRNYNLHSVVLNPSWDRTTIKSGAVVAWRKSESWSSHDSSSSGT